MMVFCIFLLPNNNVQDVKAKFCYNAHVFKRTHTKMLITPQTAAPSWDEPIEMLLACHGKVRKFCHQLTLLPDYLTHNGLDQSALTSIHQILTYFNKAAPLHHEDEELDFFPTLLRFTPHVKDSVDELLRQHQSLHSGWEALRRQLNSIMAGETLILSNSLVHMFVAGYERHMALEEPLFEQGREDIPEEQLKEIGRIMAERRQPKKKLQNLPPMQPAPETESESEE